MNIQSITQRSQANDLNNDHDYYIKFYLIIMIFNFKSNDAKKVKVVAKKTFSNKRLIVKKIETNDPKPIMKAKDVNKYFDKAKDGPDSDDD